MLQRVLKLDEEAPVADHALTFLEPAVNLSAAVGRFAHGYQAARELIGARLDVDEGQILGGGQNSRVRYQQSLRYSACTDGRRHVHIFLELVARVFGHDARLQSARGGIERRREVGNPSPEDVGVSIR